MDTARQRVLASRAIRKPSLIDLVALAAHESKRRALKLLENEPPLITFLPLPQRGLPSGGRALVRRY